MFQVVSCCRGNSLSSVKTFGASNRFSSRITVYLAPYIIQSPGASFLLAEEKHPNSMLLSPPCFTMERGCSWCYILVLIDKCTFFYILAVSSTWFVGLNCKQDILWLSCCQSFIIGQIYEVKD
ncbi:hypothetical protein ATANTOWER_023680 [Ataeniobius toweri]|uniref:Uncharacterized protein n=1 Tax=Ataeniobius toweri TaxID=208326 RepID=A0ABU7C2F4_9TELE|nr:hypothetical protein [Ataeniobius toweri]